MHITSISFNQNLVVEKTIYDHRTLSLVFQNAFRISDDAVPHIYYYDDDDDRMTTKKRIFLSLDAVFARS